MIKDERDIIPLENTDFDEEKGDNNLLNNHINMIITQTNYTKDIAREKLIELKDPLLVIKKYLDPDYDNKDNNKNNKSLNQQIYSEIRNQFYTQNMNSVKY